MSEHLKRYVEYIRNTAQRPLPCAAFDEDWEPIGPRVRGEMTAMGLVEAWGGAMMLTDKGEALARDNGRRPQGRDAEQARGASPPEWAEGIAQLPP